MRQLTGTHITIIAVAFLVLLGGLAITGKDSAAFVAVGGVILAGMGFGGAQLSQVKENTNGNLSALMDQLKHLTNVLVASQPTPEALAMLKPVSAIPAPPSAGHEPPDPASDTSLLPRLYS